MNVHEKIMELKKKPQT